MAKDSLQLTPSGNEPISVRPDGDSSRDSPNSSCLERRETHATSGPSNRDPRILREMRVILIVGANAIAAMKRANKFIVDELWVIATVVSKPDPLRLNPFAIGTMQAEHRLSTGPMITLFKTPRNPEPKKRSLLFGGKRNASVIPATTKANNMPIDTFFRYSIENSHHLSRRGLLCTLSIQKPWKHSDPDEATTARSASMVSNFGKRLRLKKRRRMKRTNIPPTNLRFRMSESSLNKGKIDMSYKLTCMNRETNPQ